ncbi:MAG: hypothetical protein NTY53_11545, partial [Kiritimatiellaeota bacterium]|nr:hypothetical protein [Kiritimatiellota bacterium]
MKKVIAPEELRQWAEEAIAQVRVQTNVSWQIEKASVPKAIRDLNSQNSPFQFAFYDTNEQDTNGRIMLCWGGGFGHW